MDEVPGEVARLRRAADDRPLDGAGERVGGAEIVLGFVLEKRSDVTERRRAGTQHVRVLDGVDQLIELRRVEAVLQAQAHGQRGDRRWREERAAAAELPVAVRDGAALRDDAIEGLVP